MLEENSLRGSLVNSNEGRGALGYKGERGYSAYELAVQNGYEGTEQDWIDHFGLDLSGYLKTTDTVNNLSSSSTVYPLSAYQGRYLKNYIDTYRDNEIGETVDLDTTSKVVVNAINEVNTKAESNKSNIGTLSSLDTTANTDLVSAINEVLDTTNDNSQIYYNGALTNISTLQIDVINTNVTAANTNINNLAISFRKSFSEVPFVLVSIRGSAGYCDHFGCNSITTTGCNLQYKHNSTVSAVYYTLLVIGKS